MPNITINILVLAVFNFENFEKAVFKLSSFTGFGGNGPRFCFAKALLIAQSPVWFATGRS